MRQFDDEEEVALAPDELVVVVNQDELGLLSNGQRNLWNISQGIDRAIGPAVPLLTIGAGLGAAGRGGVAKPTVSLPWTSWPSYPKVTRAGTEYAQIGIACTPSTLSIVFSQVVSGPLRVPLERGEAFRQRLMNRC